MRSNVAVDGPVDVRARRRITRRILPYLFLLYVIAYLDRVNVGYAALQMTGALHFTPDVYGFGVGVFFIGYFLLAMGLFWAGQGANLIRWPAESFMVNARQWIYYGGGIAVIGLVLILLARRQS